MSFPIGRDGMIDLGPPASSGPTAEPPKLSLLNPLGMFRAFWAFRALLQGARNCAAGRPTTPLPPLVPPRAVEENLAPANAPLWIVRGCWLWLECQTARARTKSEARAVIKRRFNLRRVPVGAFLTRAS